MKFFSFLFVSFLFFTVTGCGEPAPPPDIIKPQRDALEKAKGLEKSLEAQAEENRKMIKDAEGK